MRKAIFITASVMLASCATAQNAEIPGCYEGPCVAIGEAQDLGSMQVTPLAVLTDSRCPIEAECVWAGELKINAQLNIGHESFETELSAWQPFTINGGTLLLAEVAPDASVEWSGLEGKDYRFRFTFTPDE
jgi:hypothetical protein